MKAPANTATLSAGCMGHGHHTQVVPVWCMIGHINKTGTDTATHSAGSKEPQTRCIGYHWCIYDQPVTRSCLKAPLNDPCCSIGIIAVVMVTAFMMLHRHYSCDTWAVHDPAARCVLKHILFEMGAVGVEKYSATIDDLGAVTFCHFAPLFLSHKNQWYLVTGLRPHWSTRRCPAGLCECSMLRKSSWKTTRRRTGEFLCWVTDLEKFLKL